MVILVIDIFTKEHFTDQFQINPHHPISVIIEGFMFFTIFMMVQIHYPKGQSQSYHFASFT